MKAMKAMKAMKTKNNLFITFMICMLMFVSSGNADDIFAPKKAAKKDGRGLEGKIETRIGSLEFINGYPSDETIDKLYNELDFQRAVQAYIWGLPMVTMAEWQKAQKDVFKAGTNDFVNYTNFTHKLGILTANATTPYMMSIPYLKETGPMVFEIPAGPTAGGLLDFWQRPFSDLGLTGPDKGQGAKYLILGPGHPEMNPEGFIVVRSPTWNVFLGHRVLHPDPETAGKLTKAHKIYPFAERANPTPTKHISAEGFDWEGFHPRGITYFVRLASILEVEPVEARDYMMMAMLRPLGIKPGVKFNPTEDQFKIFEEAALVGEAISRANSYEKRFDGAQVWKGKLWEYALFLADTDQDLETHTQLDERASWFYEAIGVTDGMMGKIVDAGQVYLEAQKDSDGNWLDGGKNYMLRVPANAPVKQFWSVTLYDNDDRCLIDTGELPDKSSRMKLELNDDGSVDLYFGPTLPAGAPKANWTKTVRGEGWFTYFRFYAPMQPYFDKTWQLPDIVKVK
jgi:hypothetical protein